MSDSEQQLLTHREAAARLRMSPTTLFERIKQGDGPKRIKVTGKVFYRPADLDAWLDEHIEEPSAS
jgi:predicted DNA-binding transcriptional regulator AlpA